MSAAASALAADPALPQRDRLLDAGFVASRLATLLGLSRPPPCVRVRAKYRIGESLRVLHRVTLEGSSVLMAVRGFPPGGSASAYLRALARAEASRLPILHDARHEAVFFPFPNDRKLRGLARICDAEWLGGWLDASLVRAELVSWAPEKGAVSRGLNARGETACYAKRYGSEGCGRPLAIHRAVARAARDHEALRVPEPLGCDAARQVVAVAAAPGRPLGELAAVDRIASTYALGRALATLHQLPAPAEAEPFVRLAPARVEDAARLVGCARPDLARRASALARGLHERAPAPRLPVLVHGDVHAKNALWDEGRLWLLDLDQAGLGSPALDLGSALAGFWASHPAREASLRAAALCSGYATLAPLPSRAELAWHAAAALLVERALRAVNRVRDAELERLPRLFDVAERTLAGFCDA